MEKILVGIVTKPQALKGEFRVKPQILNFKQFKKFESVIIDNIEYNIERVSIRDAFVIIKIESVDSCEQAELLRNKQVYAYMQIDTNDNLDLVDFSVKVGDKVIGSIVDINNYGSKDIISVSGACVCMFPLIEDLIVSIDEKNKEIVLDTELFEQVVVYEN